MFKVPKQTTLHGEEITEADKSVRYEDDEPDELRSAHLASVSAMITLLWPLT